MWAPIEATMARQIRRLTPIPLGTADPATRAVAAQIARDFGAFVPPFALHAAVPSLLAACWTMLREALVETHVDRARKEAVATAVSRANVCTYCVDAHAAALHALGDATTADALSTNEASERADPRLAPLVAWAAATRNPDDPLLRRPPCTPAALPELVAIALAFHYVNRMVAVFLTTSPLPVTHPRLKAWARRLLAPLLRGTLTRPLAAGEALAFLSPAPLPNDLAWARSHPILADALARAAAAFDAAGTTHVAAPVRALVAERVAAWRGADPGLGRQWLGEATARLDPPTRPAARLALLGAFAPAQVDDALIADCRRAGATDATLVATAGWASFTAARRIAAWSADAASGAPLGASARVS